MLIWFSPKALHVGVIAHDSVAGSVRATVADRDNIANDDWVRVYLDTFNDRRRAFIFGVNPLGVQEDGVQTEGGFSAGMTRGGGGGGYYGGNFMSGQVDLSPDYQFDSKGTVSDDGYVVEIRIPFKSLRYPGGGPMKWGINIQRKTQRTGRQDTWTDAKRVASFLAQAGTMEGLHDLQRGVVTELQPFVTGSVDGARGDDGRYAYGTTDIEPGRQPALRVHEPLARRDGEPRLQPGGDRRHPGDGERALRALLSREAARSSSKASSCSPRPTSSSTRARSPTRSPAAR